jgi:hypothetical protein
LPGSCTGAAPDHKDEGQAAENRTSLHHVPARQTPAPWFGYKNQKNGLPVGLQQPTGKSGGALVLERTYEDAGDPQVANLDVIVRTI